MKLYERFGDRGFHTCLITTFGVDFGAFESIVLPRLRGAGCFNTALLADNGMLAYALEGPNPLPDYAGRHYTVTGIGAEGVFHPKVVLQLGRAGGRVIVSSANMTTPGLAGNLELAGEIRAELGQEGERRLLAAAWGFFQALMPAGEQGVAYQLDWMRRRTAWLLDTEPTPSPVALADGSTAAWLASGEATGIGARFAGLVVERPIQRLIVLSPYWDSDLAALNFLMEELQPRETVMLIDAGRALFPGHAARGMPSTSIYDLAGFGENRFIHAKAILAETEVADHVLYGSANCTVAALGTGREAGTNSEACFYRRLAPTTVLAQLGLSEFIAETTPMNLAHVPAWAAEDEVPLAEALHRSPGRFEALFDNLSWNPPSLDVEDASIELLDRDTKLLSLRLERLSGGGPSPLRRYRMSGMASYPSFARLRFPGGFESSIAIVTAVGALREEVREARSTRAEAAATRLS
jgi:hypothetical protein